jgi:hypothetical protein
MSRVCHTANGSVDTHEHSINQLRTAKTSSQTATFGQTSIHSPSSTQHDPPPFDPYSNTVGIEVVNHRPRFPSKSNFSAFGLPGSNKGFDPKIQHNVGRISRLCKDRSCYGYFLYVSLRRHCFVGVNVDEGEDAMRPDSQPSCLVCLHGSRSRRGIAHTLVIRQLFFVS